MIVSTLSRLLVLLHLALTVTAQVSDYTPDGQNYFINPPIPVYGSGDYRGLRTYSAGSQFNITWSKDQPYIWLVLAQEGNPATRTLVANTSATYFVWSTDIAYTTSANNQTFFFILYEEPTLGFPYLAISQYFNITTPVSSTTTSTLSSTTLVSVASSSSSPSSPASTTTNTATATSSASQEGNGQGSYTVPIGVGVGVGVGVGLGAALLIAGAATWYLRRRSHNKQEPTHTPSIQEPTPKLPKQDLYRDSSPAPEQTQFLPRQEMP